MNGSESFRDSRGVMQGDILSTILFNCVLDLAFERFKDNLGDQGIFIANGCQRLTNIRCADNVMLFANSLDELVDVAELLIQELNTIGLKLNADKSKILRSDLAGDDEDTEFHDIDRYAVEVLSLPSPINILAEC